MSGPADSVYFVNCSNPRSKPTTALLDSSVPASFVLTSVGRSTVWFCSCTAVVETALVLSLAELHSIGLEPSCLELYLSSFDLSYHPLTCPYHPCAYHPLTCPLSCILNLNLILRLRLPQTHRRNLFAHYYLLFVLCLMHWFDYFAHSDLLFVLLFL